jgi:hypothetical protein
VEGPAASFVFKAVILSEAAQIYRIMDALCAESKDPGDVVGRCNSGFFSH